MKFNSIAVVGAGAVGCYYGGRLAQSGRHVTFLMRRDLDHVRQHGLTVESAEGGFHLPQVVCAASTQKIGPVDLVIIALKTTDNDALVSLIPPLLHEETCLLTLQNGLGNENFLAKHFGAKRVLGGLCFVCLNRVAPGVIRHIGHGLIEMGEFTGALRERSRSIADLFNASGIRCNLLESLELSRWRKLVWNIPFNGLSIAAGGIDVARILADPELQARVLRLMEEVIATAGRLGHSIPKTFAAENIRRTLEMGEYQPSSLIDFLANKSVEVESIWTEPLRRGQAAALAMPELARLEGEIREALANRPL